MNIESTGTGSGDITLNAVLILNILNIQVLFMDQAKNWSNL